MRDYEYSDLYFDAHLDKQMQIEVLGTGITIDNSMIELDAFELDEILCSEQELTFGSCEANCVKFTARDMPGSIVGKTIRITETVDGNTDVPFQYGIYKVYSDVPSSDRTKREITAYDAMYDIVNTDVKSWYAGLSFPMTLRQFRDSFFAYFGITQKETTLVNDAMTVNRTLVATQTDSESTITEESAISGKTVVTAICEINGVFGNINRDGEFEYVELEQITNPLYPANDLYPSDDLFPRDPNTISMTGHYITFDYEDFQTNQITQLEIRPGDDSAGAVVGTSGNNYVISGNFLISDKTGAELETIAANTLSIIRRASYTPIKSSEVVGNPCIELGDPIRFNTTREIVESYVLQRTLTGIQNKRDSIVSSGTETYSQNTNGIREQIESVQRRTNKLERTADHTLSELADLDANTSSRFEQTASEIAAEVLSREGADRDIMALLELKIDADDDGKIISLINGSADKIHFNANNMFVVDSPNFIVDENGNVEIGGSFVADTCVSLCYNYASLPGITYASKVDVLNIGGGEFSIYGIYSGGIIQETSTAVGASLPILNIGSDGKIQVIKTDKQFQAASIYGSVGIFHDIGLPFTSGVNGGRIYKCYGGYGTEGIASPGYVQNWCAAQGYAKSGQSNLYGLSESYTGYMVVTSNVYRIAVSTNGTLAVASTNGTFSYASASDAKLKRNIGNSTIDALSVIKRIRHRSFDWISDGNHVENGYIAQELETIDRNMVIVNTDLNGERWYSVDNLYMTGLCTKAIQEQQEEIEALKIENLELRSELEIIKRELEEIKNVINNKINQS